MDRQADAYDAILQHIFRETQGDAWFQRAGDDIKTGVCIRTGPNAFRVFPENVYLMPFEAAVQSLNPEIAVKLRSASISAALASVTPTQTVLFVDAENRIQIVPTMDDLASAEKGQGAAFIYDEKMLVVWADQVEDITDQARAFEKRLLSLVWKSRPVAMGGDTTSGPVAMGMPGAHHHHHHVRHKAPPPKINKASVVDEAVADQRRAAVASFSLPSHVHSRRPSEEPAQVFPPYTPPPITPLTESDFSEPDSTESNLVEEQMPRAPPVDGSYADPQFPPDSSPFQDGGAFFARRRQDYSGDTAMPSGRRLPPVNFVIEDIDEEEGQSDEARAPRLAQSSDETDDGRETLTSSEPPSPQPSLPEENMIVLPVDGPETTSDDNRKSTGKEESEKGGFKRAGRFKKASNMNYGLKISLRMEEILKDLKNNPELAEKAGIDLELDDDAEMAERALEMAVEETNGEAWAAGGQALRVGEVILIVDSDTMVPEDCLRDAARELAQCPEVAIIQHESDVMQVAHHYFEDGIAYFTRRVNHAISIACANGEVAPFVGHNAFLRWQAVQEAAFIDPADGLSKIWSESNVSEDFDMALRLQLKGYTIRWATYSHKGFQEGVSLTCDDELNRWQKYAYGCSELIFTPFKDWWRRGPITKQLHTFIWSDVPIHYKMSMMAYMFSYYGIAAALPLSLLNYILLGFTIRVDAFYNHGFELFLACSVLFFGAGNIGHSILEYRLNQRGLLDALLVNFKWLPYFIFFFGGLSLHLVGALLAHMFSYDITWGATVKEVEDSNFFKEVPRIFKRFYGTIIVCGAITAGMILLATPLVPMAYRVDGGSWAVILPLAVQVGCHLLYPIVLNPWLMIFSY